MSDLFGVGAVAQQAEGGGENFYPMALHDFNERGLVAGVETLDEGRVVSMKKGDVMIQRGTNHAWINRGKEICRMAFVLIDAEPLGIGHAVPRGGVVGPAGH